ncbi:unnamed protein product [Pieris brassicae]|uniref:Uncharacterized protein n=1 Tax=Pieris brassicae TaxID=7116 RepID=A0A9P0TU74_PIEBR|nr:unnamed protein product [Pieris brassicae]
MALCVCKCLNVTINCAKVDQISEIERRDLSSTEQRDIFFNENLISCQLSTLEITIIQPSLISSRPAGQWSLESCLACGVTFVAKLQEKDLALINTSLQTTQENINNLKKSSSYSPVFNLLVPESNISIDIKENVDTNNILSNKTNLSSMAAVGLRKQLNKSLQNQLETIEDMVRQYKEQKYAEYEAYRERAQREHKILSSIISKAQSNESEGWHSSVVNGPPSPLAPPLQRRRLSSIKDSKKFSHNIKARAQIPQEEDSLDAEDIFDLEGMDSRNMVSDFDDYDSDPEDSNDEGIHISRGRAGAGADVARSLPVNVPNFPERHTQLDLDDYEEPQDIAASIKALARSVHGDVFELPRPRFSTQI